MDDVILNVNTLPEPLYRRIRSDTVRVHEENGVIMLTPVKPVSEQEQAVNRLCGMFTGKLSTEGYMAQKQLDKELEG
jgi:hypothetical protein